MFATLFSAPLTGATFQYLRVISFLQIVQTVGSVFLIGNTKLFMDLYQNKRMSYFCFKYLNLCLLPFIMAASKLSAFFLCFFMTLERFLTICFAHKYANMNRERFFKGAVLVSAVVISFEVPTLARIKSDLEKRDGFSGNAAVSNARPFIRQSIFLLKFLMIIALVVFSSAIIRRLRIRARNIGGMVSGESALRQFKEMLHLSRFQLIDALVTSIETLAWSSTNDIDFLSILYDAHILDTLSCSFRAKMDFQTATLYSEISKIIAEIPQSMANGELFLVYLAISKRFRGAFSDFCVRVWKKTFAKLKQHKNVVQPITVPDQRLVAESATPVDT